MAFTVQDALEARKKKAEKSNSFTVEKALEDRKKRLSSNIGSIMQDISTRYDSAIKTYNEFYPSANIEWGGDFSSVEDTHRTNTLELSHLKKDIEAYRSFYDENTFKTMMDELSQLSSSYNGVYQNAKIRSQFGSEAEYNDALKLSELYNMSSDEILPYLEEKSSRNLSGKLPGKDTPEDTGTWLDELEEKGKAKATSEIAYTTSTGQNITWRQLYDEKVAEENHLAIYNPIKNSTDFKASVQKAKDYQNPDARTAEKGKSIVNKVKYYEENEGMIAIGELNGGGSDIVSSKIRHMKDEEKDIYNYYFGRGEYDKAEAYLTSLEEVLRKRDEGAQVESWKEVANKLPFTSSVISVFASTLSGAEYIHDTADYLFGSGELDDNHLANVSTAIRGAVSEKVDWEIGNWDAFDFLYNTGMSMADSATSMALLGSGGGVALGLSAAAQGTNSALERGMSNKDAFFTGFTSGVFEGVFETWSIGKLKALKDVPADTFKGIAKNIGRAMLSNAEEEAVTELANVAYDYFMNADFSQIETSVRMYMAAGMSEEEARSKVRGETFWQIVEAGASGALMGLGMGGGAQAIGYASNRLATGQNIIDNKGYDDLRALAESVSAEASGIPSIDKAIAKADKKTSAWNVGGLSQKVDNVRSSQNTSDIKNALVEKGMSEKEASKTAQKIIEVADKQAREEELTESEYKDISKDSATQEVYSSLISNPDSSVHSRNLQHNNARNGVTTNEDGSVKLSEGAQSRYVDRVIQEVALNKIASDSRYGANTGIVEKDADGIELMTEEDAAAYKGKTTYTSPEGETKVVKVKGISSIKDGEMMLKLEGGETVNASDVRFSSEGEALVYSAVVDMGVNAGVAEALVNEFKASDVDAGTYALGIKDAYTLGTINAPLSELSANSFAHKLSDAQRKYVYKLGQTEAEAQTKANQKARDAKVAEAKSKGTVKPKVGKVIVEDASIAVDENGNIDESSLNDMQKASIIGIKALAEMSPINFHIFQSDKVNGKFVATINGEVVEESPNGVYFKGTNDIWLDLNSGNMGEGTMLWTAAHEISHYIRERSPAKWRKMANFLMKEYAKNKDVSISDMLDNQKAVIMKREDAGTKSEAEITNEAYEELVSDALSDMLVDGNVVNFLAELKQKDKGLWQAIKDAIADLLKRWGEVLGVYKDRDADTAEAQALRGMEEAYKKLQKMYAEAFAEANAVEEAEAYLKENGIDIISDGKQEAASLNSVRTVLNKEQQQKVAKALAERFGVAEEDASEWLKAETSLASLILNPKYSQYLDYEADASEDAIKKNSDYPQGTVDFSNNCPKRRAFTEVMNRVLRNFPNHVFMATDLAKIRTIMEEEGLDVACAICYVEDRRQLDSIVAKDFIDSLELYRNGSKTRPDGKPFNANQLKAFSLIEGDTYTPSIYELVSLEGRNELKAKNSAMEEAWVKFNNARGMQSVRLLLNEAEYKRQILKYTEKTVQSKNDLGGLRIYSFSDAEMFHLIDIIQVITDSATVGLMLQGYTKVNEYARAVKDTGEKLNRSLIPLGELGYHIEDGKIVLDYDTVEGIDINHPDFFDNSDNPNVGNIVIGINDRQIRAAMVSDFIDQIIPFHTGQSAEVLGEKGIGTWDNYKDFQSEKDISTGKKSEHQINIYTEVIQAAEKEGKPIKNKVDFVNKFLEVCKENDLEPRFSQFLNTNENGDYVYTEGYHKFLVDFKTFDQKTGEYLPQMPVKPIFDDKYLTGLLKSYAKSQAQKDADTAKSMPKVIERITNEVVKPNKPKAMHSERITADMSDAERADVLKKKNITNIPTVTNIPNKILQKLESVSSWDDINKLFGSEKRTLIQKIASEFGVFKGYKNEDINISFEFSNNNYRESYGKQKKDFANFAKMFSVFDSVVENAIGIEIHKRENYKPDATLKNVYVLISAFEDGDLIVPVKLEVKEFKDKQNTLYVAISLQTIKKTEVSKQGTTENGVAQGSRSVTINVADLMRKVNPLDTNFTKYFPEELLTDEQRKGLEPVAKFSERNKAPTFYSHMGKVVDGIKNEKVGAGGVVPYLKGKGVKNEEIKWSGIEAFLEGKKSVTKAELQEFVAGSMLQIGEQMSGINQEAYNELNRLWEEHIGGSIGEALDEITADSVNDLLFDMDRDGLPVPSSEIQGKIITLADKVAESNARWDKYKLDGGENYRELVFTMPNSSYSNNAMKAHWGQDAEGVLAHARIQDFDTSEGKMLFIEEIQSDWHNEGHSKGYLTKELEQLSTDGKALSNAIRNMENEMGDYLETDAASAIVEGYMHFYDIEYADVAVNRMLGMAKDSLRRISKSFSDELLNSEAFGKYQAYIEKRDALIDEADRIFDEVQGKIPDAPFKDTYHEYVMKRLIRMAAENGYDVVGWTTADIQSDRWSDQYAEGYRIEYDQDIPKFLNKYGKKWGAKVDKTKLSSSDNYMKASKIESRALEILSEKGIMQFHWNWSHEYGLAYEQAKNEISQQGDFVEVWSMPVTDAMKESVLYEGQALYSERKTDSNRSLLANALETTVQDESEAQKLKQYKEKIDLIDAEQQKLAEINAEIRELSFAKGARDEKRLKSLRFDAVQAANRINTYDRQLLNLESTKVLKKVLEREKALARKKQKAENAEVLKEYKQKALEERQKLMQKNQESRKKATEGRQKTIMRHKIRGVISELNSLFSNGTKEKNVKKGLRETVATAIASAELLFSDDISNEMVVRHGFSLPLSDKENRYASDYAQALQEIDEYEAALEKLKDSDDIGKDQKRREYLDGMWEQKRKLKKLDKLLSEAFERERKSYNSITTETILKELASTYGKLKDANEDYLRASYDDSLREHIYNLAEYLADEPTVRDMSLDSLQKVYKAYRMVLTAVKKANSTFKAGKAESISSLGNNTMGEVKDVGGSKTHVLGGKIGSAISAVKSFDFNNLKPVHFFERIGSKTLSMLFENVRKGEDTWAVDITEAKDFKESVAKKYGYDKWDFDKVYTFKSSMGNEFTLTLEQMMSLYAYSKRDQALPHLAEGGFVFDQAIETYKEKEDGKKSILKYRVNTADAYKISSAEVNSVIAELGKIPGAIKFVDEMQDYLSTVMGGKGNEISMEMYGVELFSEKFYFPLKSAQQYMFEQNEVAGEVKLKNASFSKETKKHANNPVILSNFMDVWANHVNDMSMYHAFVLPLEDFNRVFNYRTSASEDLDSMSVKGFIQNAYGTQANQYISQLLKDLNGGARVDPRESIGRRMMGKFKKASVMASASVIVQQPSAIARALAEIDVTYFNFNPKYIIHKKHWAELKKYAPVAIIKEMGHFDTDMGMSSVDYIRGDKSLMDKADDALSKPAAYMDELTWVHIWTAVKRETMAKNKGLKGEELLKKAGERFTEVITKTQVYDSVLSRSANMRSKSMFMNMITSFMAEPTTAINLIENAIVDIQRGRKGKGLRTIGSVASSVVLNSLLVSLVYAMRDDDEDETYLEKYLGSFTSEILDGLNPITYYPLLKDVWSIMQGYEVQRSDMTLIDKAVGSLKDVITVMTKDTEDMTEAELAEHNKEVRDAWLGIAGEFSSLFGIPAKNIIRDVKAIFNTKATVGRGQKTSLSLILDEMAEAAKGVTPIVGWLPGDSKTDKLYEAIVNGDSAYISRLKSGYKDENAYNNAVSKALREHDSRIRKAAEARLSGDMTLYKQIALEIKGEGHFSQDTIVRAINTEMNALSKDDSASSGVTEKPMYTNADYYRAAIGGDSADVKAVKEYLLESGKKESSIESSFNSSVKDAYEEGEIDSMKAVSLMVEYGGKTSEEAGTAIKYVDFKSEYSDTLFLTENQYVKYYEPIEGYGNYSLNDMGISFEAYADYCYMTHGIKGTDEDGDGKTDSGSKKAAVMQVINSLPLTTSQKDALYYLNGWSAKTIYEAPWH